jgi:hypothetical protein
LLWVRSSAVIRVRWFGAIVWTLIGTLLERGTFVEALLVFGVVRRSPVIEARIDHIGIDVIPRVVSVRTPAVIASVVIAAPIASAVRISTGVAGLVLIASA